MSLYATPNLTGNPPEHFTKHGREVAKLARQLREALAAARTDCLHGRNYQTVENAELARKADLLRVDSYLTAAIAAENFGHDLMLEGMDK